MHRSLIFLVSQWHHALSMKPLWLKPLLLRFICVPYSSKDNSILSNWQVLQHLMDGLISFTFRPEDLQCSFFRYTVRELLACAVMRPVLNLASPR